MSDQNQYDNVPVDGMNLDVIACNVYKQSSNLFLANKLFLLDRWSS